jgi:hypothetical protein
VIEQQHESKRLRVQESAAQRPMHNLNRVDICLDSGDHFTQHMKVVLDELFGEENFLAQIMWQKMYSGKAGATHFWRFMNTYCVTARILSLRKLSFCLEPRL